MICYEYSLKLSLENDDGDVWSLTFAHYWDANVANDKGRELVGQVAFGSIVKSFLVINQGTKS